MPRKKKPADWLDFRNRIIRSLAPEGDLEIELALTVAEGLWRRRRIARYEQHIVQIERQRDGAKEAWRKHREQKVGPDATAPAAPRAASPAPASPSNPAGGASFYADALASMFIESEVKPERMLPEKGELGRIIRYEQHITRQLWHALHELQALQSARRGEPAPLARVSFLERERVEIPLKK